MWHIQSPLKYNIVVCMVSDIHRHWHSYNIICPTQHKHLSFLTFILQTRKRSYYEAKVSSPGIADIRERIIDNLKDDRKVPSSLV